MTGYTCKYTPIELLAAFGGAAALLQSEADSFSYAEGLTHSNLCCHAKAMLETSRRKNCVSLLLVNCCDSIRRAYDALCAEARLPFLFLLDLPHLDNTCARKILLEELLRLAEAYGAYRETAFDEAAFRAAFTPRAPLPTGPFVGVLGARVSSELLGLMQDMLPLPVADLTCGGNRSLPPPPAELHGFLPLMEWYAGELLAQTPCLRMDDVRARRALLESPYLTAILYHTVKFCDYYGFEYESLRRNITLPLLKIESDFTPQAEGQLSTRLRAFGETLVSDAPPPSTPAAPAVKRSQAAETLVAGIDSGSTTTNVVVLDAMRAVRASAIVRTGPRAATGAARAFAQIGESFGISRSALTHIVATGYGRQAIPFADSAITEITCHAKGAFFLHPEARTIIDIGGQDSKVICLAGSGSVCNFVMNDKCAAGTGRFLELMARTLEVSPETLGQLGLSWKKDLTISSMCTVFAESEVVSLIADNNDEADIVHGLCKAVASRTGSLVLRAGGKAPYMMTGGVARNPGVVKALEETLDAPLWIAPDPDLCGALGAALFALDL